MRNDALNPPGGNVHDVRREWLARLPDLAVRWRAGEFDAAVFAARYFFLWQMALHGPPFAARKSRRDPRPDAAECLAVLEAAPDEVSCVRLLDWLDRWQFRGVTGIVPVALAQWLRGAWPLVLREDIPSPLEVLRLQARGRRAVTALTTWPRVLQPVLNKPDAFAFFLHDLEHGYKFFHSPALYAGQRGFFIGLEAAYDRGVFTPYFSDAGFVGKFHYLMSDMNTHPEHSRQYLRAILIEFHLRRENRALTEPLSPAAERDIVDVMRAMTEPAFRACA